MSGWQSGFFGEKRKQRNVSFIFDATSVRWPWCSGLFCLHSPSRGSGGVGLLYRSVMPLEDFISTQADLQRNIMSSTRWHCILEILWFFRKKITEFGLCSPWFSCQLGCLFFSASDVWYVTCVNTSVQVTQTGKLGCSIQQPRWLPYWPTDVCEI